MSYDIYIVDENDDTIELDNTHNLTGGTYAVGGTDKAWLNITYNYGHHYYDIWDEGLNGFHKKPVSEVIPKLEKAVKKLGTQTTDDYWKSTAGNAGKALSDLLSLCRLCPDGKIQIT